MGKAQNGNNMGKAKKNLVQMARIGSQFIFLALLIVGVYMDLRMVLIILLPATLIFGNFFCGWVCPYGTVQELASRIGGLIFKRKFMMPRPIAKYLQYLRYILFIVLLIGVLDFILTPLNSYGTFMGQFMEEMASGATVVSLVIMSSFILISVFFERPYCNYLCTEAAKYGVLSMTRIFSIKRNESSCVNCKKCDKVCPMNIEVSLHDQVRNGQCINCMKCISACPVDNTLNYSRVKWPIGKHKKK